MVHAHEEGVIAIPEPQQSEALQRSTGQVVAAAGFGLRDAARLRIPFHRRQAGEVEDR